MGATSTVTIDKFLGMNLSDSGDTNLKLGELSRCDNIRIIDNYKARRRNGYEDLFDWSWEPCYSTRNGSFRKGTPDCSGLVTNIEQRSTIGPETQQSIYNKYRFNNFRC